MSEQSKRWQLVFLFSSSFLVLFVGMGLFPLLPLYAGSFGVGAGTVGLYFAMMYVSNGAGPMVTGWLAGRVARKRLFVVAGAVGTPALALLGRAAAFWQVVLLTSLVWFAGGTIMALVSVFTGLYANGNNRGRSFSIMSLASPLGALVGGALIGGLVDRAGYPTMFAVLGGVWIALPAIGLFLLKDQAGPPRSAKRVKPATDAPTLGWPFYTLMFASLLAATAVNISRLGTSLSMQAQAFSASAIASSATVSGLVTIPVTLLIGVLSDRLGRRRFLALGYLLAGAGALSLLFASQVWHYWLAATAMLVAFTVNRAMGSAVATDLLPPEGLNRGLSWLNASGSAASVVSFAATGFVMDGAGPGSLFLAAALVAMVAVVMLELLGCASRLRSAWSALWARPSRHTAVQPLAVGAIARSC
jgi:MFS family permease